MSAITPNTLKRRLNSRMKSNKRVLKQMELRAHTETIRTYKEEITDTVSDPRYEQSNFKISKELIESQPEITLPMRPILFDFLLEVHSKLRLTNQVFYSTVNIIDRYSSVRIVRKDHLQLLGLTALWLSCKFFENKPKIPNLQFLNATCCNCYSKVLFTEMEGHILKTLAWEISSKTHDFLIDLKIIELNYTNDIISCLKYSANFICQVLQFYSDVTLENSVEDIVDSTLVILSQALSLDISVLEITPNFELIDEITQTLNKAKQDFPQSVKARYFNNNDDLHCNKMLVPLLHHLRVISTPKLQESFFPSTPGSSDSNSSVFSATSNVSSPFSFRGSFQSSSSSIGTNFTFTPPTSVAASPIENMVPKRTGGIDGRESKRSRLNEFDNYF